MRARARSMRAEAGVLREAEASAAPRTEIPNNLGAVPDRFREEMWRRKSRLHEVADQIEALAFALERSADGVEQATLDFQLRSQSEGQGAANDG